MDYNIPTPRFVTCSRHEIDYGNLKEYQWDSNFISVDESLHDDLLMLQNVFEGNLISSTIYPLIYETKSHQKQTSLRSLEFYREVEKDNKIYSLLSGEEKNYFLIGIRDLFIASCRNMLTDEEKELLKKMVNLVDLER